MSVSSKISTPALMVSGGLHQRCIQEVPKAWPGWIQKAAGKSGRARPSQDLRVLQYFEKAGKWKNMEEWWRMNKNKNDIILLYFNFLNICSYILKYIDIYLLYKAKWVIYLTSRMCACVCARVIKLCHTLLLDIMPKHMTHMTYHACISLIPLPLESFAWWPVCSLQRDCIMLHLRSKNMRRTSKLTWTVVGHVKRWSISTKIFREGTLSSQIWKLVIDLDVVVSCFGARSA